jgi:hypothetical protein
MKDIASVLKSLEAEIAKIKLPGQNCEQTSDLSFVI